MPLIQNTVRGALVVNSLPERACFTTLADFINQLPALLAVEVPSSISNVIISRDSPGEDDRNKVWLRQASNGEVIGWYVFSGDHWVPFYNIPREQIVWLYGNSAEPPEGFVFITEGDPVIISTVVDILRGQYISNNIGGFYYYAARYEGP